MCILKILKFRSHPLIDSPQMPSSQGEVGLALGPALPWGHQVPSDSSHHLLPLRMCVSWGLESVLAFLCWDMAGFTCCTQCLLLSVRKLLDLPVFGSRGPGPGRQGAGGCSCLSETGGKSFCSEWDCELIMPFPPAFLQECTSTDDNNNNKNWLGKWIQAYKNVRFC